ncbi:recombinase family protein [Nonomuraea fuscirosea]|uniref:recombinase family protein n=1 Tax=Nonomuraea fuscirosea TaxID=1291556 RepID=UPI0034051D26
MLFGYARVSTADQKPDHQIDALLRAGVARENVHLDTLPDRRRFPFVARTNPQRTSGFPWEWRTYGRFRAGQAGGRHEGRHRRPHRRTLYPPAEEIYDVKAAA